VAEIFRALTNRLRDSTWTIVFKSLIIIHLMIREGEPEVTLKYLAQNPHRKLAINSFTEGTFPRTLLLSSDEKMAIRQGHSLVDTAWLSPRASILRRSR
jgi:hypothetical protein